MKIEVKLGDLEKLLQKRKTQRDALRVKIFSSNGDSLEKWVEESTQLDQQIATIEKAMDKTREAITEQARAAEVAKDAAVKQVNLDKGYWLKSNLPECPTCGWPSRIVEGLKFPQVYGSVYSGDFACENDNPLTGLHRFKIFFEDISVVNGEFCLKKRRSS